MRYRFDLSVWIRQQLPPVLHNRGILAVMYALVSGIREVQKSFDLYAADIDRRLSHNSATLSLSAWLNDLFGLNDAIYITNYVNDIPYLSYERENIVPLYLQYQAEGKGVYLNSQPPTVYGGFVINIPKGIASEANIATIRKWVDYYKVAGVTYKIQIYG